MKQRLFVFVNDSGFFAAGRNVDKADEQRNLIGFVQTGPDKIGEFVNAALDVDQSRLSFKAGKGTAIILIGVDETARPGLGVCIGEGLAQGGGGVAAVGFEDGQPEIVAVFKIHQAADARGKVGAVRLEGAGAEGFFKSFALSHQVVDGIGLVAVGDDGLVAHYADGGINDQAGIRQFGRIEGLGADAAAIGNKDPVAAVFAAAHDEVGGDGFAAVLAAAQNDAPAGVGGAFQFPGK